MDLAAKNPARQCSNQIKQITTKVTKSTKERRHTQKTQSVGARRAVPSEIPFVTFVISFMVRISFVKCWLIITVKKICLSHEYDV
jgi:hypothetical protein